jgi:hypothetical protein
MNVGGLQSNEITSEDRELYRKAYDAVLSSPNQAALYRQVPLVYTWAARDFAGDGSNKMSTGRTAARQTYREYAAAYPLPEGENDGPIYQAFTVGRARFILSDTRSERDPADASQGPEKSMLGTAQKEWLKQELLAAKGKFPVIFWVSTVSWIGKPGEDNWGAYEDERREIANFIKENGITGVCILSGDAHMLAADDGTNSDFATDGGAPLPVLQAASLDSTASFSGGPYSNGFYGPRKDEGCYGLVRVEDKGSSIDVSFSGLNDRNQERISLRFSAPYIPGGATPPRSPAAPRPAASLGGAEPARSITPAAPRTDAPATEDSRDMDAAPAPAAPAAPDGPVAPAASTAPAVPATLPAAPPAEGEAPYVAPGSEAPKDDPESTEATRDDER